MSHLLDASVLMAAGWDAHVNHDAANRWLASINAFSTCSVTQMAFIRVSMSQTIAVTFEQAQQVLADLVNDQRHHLVADDVSASSLPVVMGNKEVTDAHLVVLVRRHGLKLATLDKALCTKPWSQHAVDYVG